MSIKDAEYLALFMLGLTAAVEIWVVFLLISTDARFKKKKEENKDEDQKR
ncbi:hypothetical protein [Bacillus cereus group sp. BceL293]